MAKIISRTIFIEEKYNVNPFHQVGKYTKSGLTPDTNVTIPVGKFNLAYDENNVTIVVPIKHSKKSARFSGKTLAQKTSYSYDHNNSFGPTVHMDINDADFVGKL